ncbi:transcriptional regulator [Allokutzneria albata]|uniref:Winged helix DNA-binding domain-containing protein n=1 Tax=Allokutzneria albata TaxID=211114 RepID=A0A1G9WCV4_ALLAB|nr:transcriptional regulator [Allokutzneria albata]SDM82394.1 Winged helix DNA-binding domain-containing protein [Allokutzneria albata]
MSDWLCRHGNLLLAAAEWREFAFARDAVEFSDSVLSKQMAMLRAAELVEVRKG